MTYEEFKREYKERKWIEWVN